LVNCPKCGCEVAAPVKTWPIPSRKSLKKNEEVKLAAIFECPSCKARFRSTVEHETKIQQTASIKNMVGRIKGIKEELMQTLMNLREKIKTLETERANLMVEIENLRKVAESRADSLESEVSVLREEVRSLKDLLGHNEEEK
jgi:chromosome segregation ATPase